VETVTQARTTSASQTRHARAARARIAVALALLVAAPVFGAPRVAAAAALHLDAGTHRISAAAPKAALQEPSIQYEQAMEHAGDVIDFAPGGRVDVPFSPRKGDSWAVDGRAPRALPAGRATGLELRADAKAEHGPARLGDDAGAPEAPDTDPVPTAEAATTVEPASYVASGSTNDAIEGAAIGASGLRREVFGFLPYWELGDSSTVLDWRTLSTVAYFSVGCTASGGLDKVNGDGSLTTGWAGWTSSKMTSVINAAHQNQARVVLAITCFAWSGTGASRQAALLGSAAARSNLARAAAAAVRDRGADGINLDFEPIVAGYAEEFTALVRSIRSELNKVAAGYQLTFCTLGSIGNQPIAEATAPGGADAVFIMGYDYRTDSSSVAGSISPLSGPKYDLTDTLKAYTARISPSKVILGVPYYGRAWSTGSDHLNAATLSGAKYGYAATPTYSDAVAIAAAHGRRWDSVEQAPWTAYRKQTCTSAYGCVTAWRQLYYDDATSLKLRYDLVIRTGLRGAGIWALGFDGTRAELRNALADKFLSDKTPPVVGIVTLAQQQRDEGFRVAWTSWDDSTIKGYDVQVSRDGGAWVSWLTGTTVTSSVYLGTDGRTYAFRVRATDVHGNVSAWNGSVSATATGVPGSVAPGGFANVLVDGLRMRSSPSTDAAIMATLSAGDALQVLGGPVSGEGYTWFEVAGPVRQWGPVDPMQVGGWVAVSGNGATNAAPRRAVYATHVDAGITGLRINWGGDRVLTPNGDGVQDKLHLGWTNQRTLDSLALRIFRLDGTLAGTVWLGGTSGGTHGYDWDGRAGGARLPDGAYVVQLQGTDGGATFSAPSAGPVSPAQVARFGIVIGPAAPASVQAFASTPRSPTSARTLTFGLRFGGPISGLSAGDLVRSGTATNCSVGAPVGAGATWTITVTGCSQGTVRLGLKADAVADVVGNRGPDVHANAGVVIDRTAPVTTTPKASLRSGVTLESTAMATGLLATVTWGGSDAGGAGIATWDVQRSLDGGTYATIAAGVPSASLAMSLETGHTYRFRVRARDRAGNVGAWVTGATTTPVLRQQTSTAIIWKGSWTTRSDSRFSGGSARFATAAGASATYTFTGRSIAWVSLFASDRGSARVYVDGVLVATVSTYASDRTFRRVAFAKSWSVSGDHTLRIVVIGTAGRPRIDVDALEVLR
jgi:spore germination protein YaaH